MGDDPSKLGPTELAVLRFVAERHPVRVGEVADYMAATSGQARTTVLTTMERLRKKRYLKQQKLRGIWHYSPTVSTSELMERLVGDFVRTVLHGSLSPFVAWLANADGITPEEIQLLKQRILELEAGRTRAMFELLLHSDRFWARTFWPITLAAICVWLASKVIWHPNTGRWLWRACILKLIAVAFSPFRSLFRFSRQRRRQPAGEEKVRRPLILLARQPSGGELRSNRSHSESGNARSQGTLSGRHDPRVVRGGLVLRFWSRPDLACGAMAQHTPATPPRAADRRRTRQ